MQTAIPRSAGSARPINPWVVFILICIPILVGAIDLTSIVVILPQATLDLLGPKGLNRAGQALWAVTAYLLAYTLSLALVGRLSDVWPRKQVFITCILIFIVGAIWAGFATDLPLTLLSALPIWPERDSLPLISLVLARIVQGIGAGASVSVGMALVSDIFPPEKRGEAISLIGALDSLGWVIGNLFAGVMLQVLPSWRWLFLINAGLALLALVGTVLALRGVRQAPGGGRFDLRGALVFAAALIALTIGVELFSHPGTSAYLLTGSSVLLFAAFIWLQLRTRQHALFDMQFIRQPEVSAALITNLIIGFALILVVAGVPLVINLRTLFLRGEGLLTGALRAGLMLCATTIPLVVAVLVGESRYRRVGAAVPVALGLGLAAVGFLGTQLWTYTAPSYVLALPLALIGTGLGLTIGPLSLVVVDAAQESARGLASSLVLTMRLLGMTLGTAPAASVTLNLANQWADAQVAPMSETFRNIARPMLIPPMATQALMVVMLLGAAACAVGLIFVYLPRLVRTVRLNRLGWRGFAAGTPTLAAGVLLVLALALLDAQVTPTVLANPIAAKLPPNIDLYAGFNIQQMFLRDTQRPLEAAEGLLRAVLAPSDTSADPAANAANATSAPASEATPDPAAQPTAQPGATPTEPAAQPDSGGGTSSDSTTDALIKLLFRPPQWSKQAYVAFCPYAVDPNDSEWCFGNSLLGWIGPQAAFALLPRTRAELDYVILFQATNRNNAIAFASSLAPEAVDLSPTIRMLTINGGLPDERRLAITDAYVIIGTPKAVEYTLNHGNLSLADQPEYRRIVGQLPTDTFATFFIRAANFENDLRPALAGLVESAVLESSSRLLSQASSLILTRTSTDPALLGLALRVDEHKVGVSVVADFPFSLQKLNALPVREAMLAMIPGEVSSTWATTRLNIAGLVREINIPAALQVLAEESGDSALESLLTNALTRGLVTGFGQAVQNLLTHAGGEALVLMLPSLNDGATQPMGVVLPLVDQENRSAAVALRAIRDRLQLVAITGQVRLSERATDHGAVVTISGDAFRPFAPGGVEYLLTKDNLLIISTGGQVEALATGITLAAPTPAARAQVEAGWPDPRERQDKFLYGYLVPAAGARPAPAAILVGGSIRRQALYIDVLIKPE
jgi:MFS family permease